MMKLCIVLIVVGLALHCSGCVGVTSRKVCWQPKFGAYGIEVKANNRSYWGPGYVCGKWPAALRWE